ncbi:MAG: hypothetical protein ACE3JN_17190 [Ectobacillus sp.]
MDSFVDWERKAATLAGKAARPRPRKASACSGKSTIKFNRAFIKDNDEKSEKVMLFHFFAINFTLLYPVW